MEVDMGKILKIDRCVLVDITDMAVIKMYLDDYVMLRQELGMGTDRTNSIVNLIGKYENLEDHFSVYDKINDCLQEEAKKQAKKKKNR
jgi:hypothetical protein